MNRTCYIAATGFGLTAVIFGAFGAHALEIRLHPDSLKAFETGVRYQMWHALLLLFLSGGAEKMKVPKLTPWLFIVGIVLFSFSIYGLSCKELLPSVNVGWLGPITPIGGGLLILGWISLFVIGLRERKA